MREDGDRADEVTADLLGRLRREAEADREEARVVRLEAIRAANGLLARAKAEATELGARADVERRLETMAADLRLVESLLRAAIAEDAAGGGPTGPGDGAAT